MLYEKRIIGFIDILGFGQLVCDSENDSDKFGLIVRVLSKLNNVDDIYGSPESFFAHSNFQYLTEESSERLKRVYEHMKADAEPLRVRVTTFSDSIVFSCAANLEGLINFRYFLIKLLVHTSEFKLLLRGGISCGSLVHSDQTIFGPAMNWAYYIESKIAKQPRIAVDEKFLSLLEELDEDPVIKVVKEELIVDLNDSVTYIDHLSLATNQVAQNMCGANSYQILVNEKNTIEALIDSAPDDPEIQAKLDWYASYFNEYLRRNPEVEVTISQIQGIPQETRMLLVTNLKVQNV